MLVGVAAAVERLGVASPAPAGQAVAVLLYLTRYSAALRFWQHTHQALCRLQWELAVASGRLLRQRRRQTEITAGSAGIPRLGRWQPLTALVAVGLDRVRQRHQRVVVVGHYVALGLQRP